jgi:hypothetical protein
MTLSFNKRSPLLIVFVLGVIVAYGYFTYVQQSDRRILVYGQLNEIEEQLTEAEIIQVNCTTFSRSRENTPAQIRQKCTDARVFIAWARSFSADPKLQLVMTELLVLVRVIEDMNDAISIRPNSELAQKYLLQIPELITSVEDEIRRVRKRIWY